jgi:hypothetical protein
LVSQNELIQEYSIIKSDLQSREDHIEILQFAQNELESELDFLKTKQLEDRAERDNIKNELRQASLKYQHLFFEAKGMRETMEVMGEKNRQLEIALESVLGREFERYEREVREEKEKELELQNVEKEKESKKHKKKDKNKLKRKEKSNENLFGDIDDVEELNSTLTSLTPILPSSSSLSSSPISPSQFNQLSPSSPIINSEILSLLSFCQPVEKISVQIKNMSDEYNEIENTIGSAVSSGKVVDEILKNAGVTINSNNSLPRSISPSSSIPTAKDLVAGAIRLAKGNKEDLSDTSTPSPLPISPFSSLLNNSQISSLSSSVISLNKDLLKLQSSLQKYGEDSKIWQERFFTLSNYIINNPQTTISSGLNNVPSTPSGISGYGDINDSPAKKEEQTSPSDPHSNLGELLNTDDVSKLKEAITSLTIRHKKKLHSFTEEKQRLNNRLNVSFKTVCEADSRLGELNTQLKSICDEVGIITFSSSLNSSDDSSPLSFKQVRESLNNSLNFYANIITGISSSKSKLSMFTNPSQKDQLTSVRLVELGMEAENLRNELSHLAEVVVEESKKTNIEMEILKKRIELSIGSNVSSSSLAVRGGTKKALGSGDSPINRASSYAAFAPLSSNNKTKSLADLGIVTNSASLLSSSATSSVISSLKPSYSKYSLQPIIQHLTKSFAPSTVLSTIPDEPSGLESCNSPTPPSVSPISPISPSSSLLIAPFLFPSSSKHSSTTPTLPSVSPVPTSTSSLSPKPPSFSSSTTTNKKLLSTSSSSSSSNSSSSSSYKSTKPISNTPSSNSPSLGIKKTVFKK